MRLLIQHGARLDFRDEVTSFTVLHCLAFSKNFQLSEFVMLNLMQSEQDLKQLVGSANFDNPLPWNFALHDDNWTPLGMFVNSFLTSTCAEDKSSIKRMVKDKSEMFFQLKFQT